MAGVREKVEKQTKNKKTRESAQYTSSPALSLSLVATMHGTVAAVVLVSAVTALQSAVTASGAPFSSCLSFDQKIINAIDAVPSFSPHLLGDNAYAKARRCTATYTAGERLTQHTLNDVHTLLNGTVCATQLNKHRSCLFLIFLCICIL